MKAALAGIIISIATASCSREYTDISMILLTVWLKAPAAHTGEYSSRLCVRRYDHRYRDEKKTGVGLKLASALSMWRQETLCLLLFLPPMIPIPHSRHGRACDGKLMLSTIAAPAHIPAWRADFGGAYVRFLFRHHC